MKFGTSYPYWWVRSFFIEIIFLNDIDNYYQLGYYDIVTEVNNMTAGFGLALKARNWFSGDA